MDYVKVIVPLRLDWEPVYRVPEGMPACTGDRVRVRVAGREYIGVIHRISGSPDVAESRIQPLMSNCSRQEDGFLAPISEEELKLWEFVADYYMCTVGEVYKAAYPAARVKVETTKSRRCSAPQGTTFHRHRRDSDVETCRRIYDGLAQGRPVLTLAEPQDARRIAYILARKTVEDGHGVLILTPEAEDFQADCLQYGSGTTPAARRDIAGQIRTGKPYILAGTRMSVFLPFTNLGLVIVLDEHSANYKQAEPAPRYNGRDVAVKLAMLHGAGTVLFSEAPSLESLANCDRGKYIPVRTEADPDGSAGGNSGGSDIGNSEGSAGAVPVVSDKLIDTTAEKRKNGMTGSLSRKLTAQMSDVFAKKGRVALLLPWKDTDEVEIEARSIFPEARTRLTVMSLSAAMRKDLSGYSLTALLCADFLLKGQDFRTDEKALRLLVSLSRRTGGNLVIQTADASHPVFAAANTESAVDALKAMMPMRRDFRLPPYSRIIDIIFKDNNDARRLKMMRALSGCIETSGRTQNTLRIILPKDSALQATKRSILKKATDFLSAHNYREFVHFDVDPF